MKSLLIFLVMVVPLQAACQEDNKPYIEVKGLAIVKVVPDQIYLRIQVSEKQKYHTDLDAKERQMLARLKTVGIDLEKDMIIKDLASNFQAKAFSVDNIVLSRAYLLRVHDAKTANRVISVLEKLQISNVIVDHLDHTRLADFKKECSIKTMVAAKSKADYLTQSIGQSVGRALYIEELPNASEARDETANTIFYGEKVTSQLWNASDLNFDEIKLECAVVARFELK